MKLVDLNAATALAYIMVRSNDDVPRLQLSSRSTSCGDLRVHSEKNHVVNELFPYPMQTTLLTINHSIHLLLTIPHAKLTRDEQAGKRKLSTGLCRYIAALVAS